MRRFGFGATLDASANRGAQERHEWEVSMNMRRDFLLLATLATAAATPTLAQKAEPWVEPAGSTPIPDFSRNWYRPSLPWYEPPASGPGPITNRSRGIQRPSGATGSAASPVMKEGVSNYDQLVGDYTNPILQPWAANVVKKFGEISLAGITYPNPSNQCWPRPVPFIFKHMQLGIIQQPDKITLIFNEDHEVRRVRLNEPHRSPVTPSWYGDSVGRYEGDTLVVDTVGVNPDRKYAMVDLFGTPYTKSLHVVERYRLRDYDDVNDALERSRNENWLPAGDVFSGHRGKFLQVHLTIEDSSVFTTPWTATLTYVPGPEVMREEVCAENRAQYYSKDNADVPTADKPDF
jgi:hypothetical protein